MLLNISSESIHSLLPLFIKVFSGMISDYLGQRKGLALLGCGGGRRYASGNAGCGIWSNTTGAFLGPLVAVSLMLLLDNDFRPLFWIALIPGLFSAALLYFGLQEPKTPLEHKRTYPIKRENLRRLGKACWW